uniref:Cellulase n=1 Tax=Saccharophagus sp. Myt-1 TaxID=796330 RepID=G9MD89_9GAMM|nr:cellulase [Saccharophagus sp. Myt-1]
MTIKRWPFDRKGPPKKPNAKKILAGLAAALSLTAMQSTAAVEPLQTSGNQILVGNQAKALGGHSLFWHNVPAAGSLYNADTVSRLKNDWNSKVIRAAIGIEVPFNSENTYIGNKGSSLAAIDRVVNAAVANDMYVIIDFHTHHADQVENVAHDFFNEVSSRYGHLNNVIYEVFNEPEWCGEHGRWASTIKPYAERVIQTIRNNDPDNLVIVGTTCFSQDVDVAAANPINDVNVAYTLHFYAATPAHQQPLRDKAQTALDRGAPLFVTEWGTTTFTGNGVVDEAQTRTWINWLNERGISHVNWSASTQPESSAIWNGDMTYKHSGLLVGELVQQTNGTTTPPTGEISGPCDLHFVPAKAEAESFCTAKGIQFEATTDIGGGQNMGWLDAGDWVTFDLDVPASGQYFIDYRVASDLGDGRFRTEAANGTALGTISVPNTGGWQNWQTQTHTVQLSQGTQTVKLVAETGGWNLNWFEVRAGEVCEGADCPCEGAECPCSDCNGTPVKFEAETFVAMQGVQLENTSDVGGGQNVGYIDSGDWITYNGALPASADNRYVVSYRVARQPSGNAKFKIEQPGGAAVYGEISVPSTGGWQTWTTINHTITIPANANGFALAAIDGGWNINWIEIKPATIQPPEPPKPPTNPLKLQAEDYINFNDTTPGNEGGAHRSDDVDIQATTDTNGGFNVGWVEAGEWLEYEFFLESPDFYAADVRVASDQTGGALQLQIDGQNVGQAITVGNTGGWQAWTTKNTLIGDLSAGTHTLRVYAQSGPLNLNWVELKRTTPAPATSCFNIAEDRLNVHLDAHCAAGSNLQYSWDFGDGNSATGLTASHSYYTNGTYTITLTVSDTRTTDTSSQQVTVDFSAPAGPVDFYGELMVNGNRIHGEKTGEPAQVRGMSFFWSNTGWGQEKWWNASTVDRMVDEFKVELVRGAMGTDEGGGYLHDASNKARLQAVVEQAIARNVYVIIDWHTHHAEDNIGEAITFFSEMAQLYGHHDNVIFEIYNEPLNTTSWGTIKHYAEQVIPAIRAHSDNLIVVGTRTWSQNVDEAAFDKINDSNTAYALHFYVGSHGNHVRNLAQTALNNGAAIFASEWGIWPNNNYDGMNADDWMNFLDQNKISWANWAISDKVDPNTGQLEPPSMFNPDGSLSSSGQYVVNKLNEYAAQAPWRQAIAN